LNAMLELAHEGIREVVEDRRRALEETASGR
jgi:hypothetical protein